MGVGQGRTVRIALVGLAVALGLAPLPSSIVEQQFSNRVYPVVQTSMTRLSNLVPFALFDALLLGVIGWWTWQLTRDISRRRASRIGGWGGVLWRLLSRSLVMAAALYLAFLLLWGLNYRRAPLAHRLAFAPERVSPEAARELALTTVRQVNALYGDAHADPPIGGDTIATIATMPPDGALADAFARMQTSLGMEKTARPARPKRTLLDPYFTSAGVTGMTDPYFLETLVASDLLSIERPFVIAHEWSHLAGFADEGEANFLGWLTCVRGGALDRYSGWLFLYSETAGGLSRADRADAAARLSDGPREDLRAIADRLRRHVRPRVSNAGWQVYDRYLKANRVAAGAASYRDVVRLVLGSTFEADWTPVLGRVQP